MFALARAPRWPELAPAWDALAACGPPSPFATHAWATAWWAAFGQGDPLVATVRSPAGELLAAALVAQDRLGGVRAAVSVHTEDWEVVARDDAARAELLAGLAGHARGRLTLGPLAAGGPTLAAAVPALRAGGWRVVPSAGNASPVLDLPASGEALVAGASRNLRSQLGRRRRALEREGELVFRTVRGPEGLDAALDAFLAVEGSGWKTAGGTAIASDPRTVALYRGLAHATARDGTLRLRLLELDGTVLAGDLSVALGGTEFLLKTGYDDAWSRLSPGLVLRGAVLAAAIDEDGARRYDFLGGPDDYKLRWTDALRHRYVLHAFRGLEGVPGEAWRRALRPAAKRARDRMRERRGGGGH